LKSVLIIAALVLYSVSYAQSFTLKSNELGGQASIQQVNNDFGCFGKNISPQLFWDNAPADTKSFAVTIYDENAPTGSGWWHWIIFNIDKGISELKADAGNVLNHLAPAESVQSKTDFGLPGYGGPCPPNDNSIHKYIITIYALKKEKLGLSAFDSPALVGFYLNQNVIEKASLVFYYRR